MEQQSATPADLATEKSSETIAFPKTKSLPAVAGEAGPAAAAGPTDAKGIFPKLVAGDDDIVGLVAYSLYKQNKIDWMRAFETQNGRRPNDEEFAAYIIGENTPRRVSIYRFLAESTIGRSGASGIGRRPLLSATLNIFYGLLGVGAVAALIVLMRFFFSLKH